MNKKVVSAVLAVALGAGAGYALNAFAQAKPAEVIKYRQSVMTLQSWHMRPMVQMLKGQLPYDAALFSWHAGVVEQTSHMLADAFAPGSDTGAPTKARPEIWKNADKFRQGIERFQADTARLVQAAGKGNLDAVKGPFGAVQKNCGGCHKEFRAK